MKFTTTSISVVTIVLNDSSKIEKTILSVLGQSYPNVEHIIKDSGSLDRTVNLITKYANTDFLYSS